MGKRRATSRRKKPARKGRGGTPRQGRGSRSSRHRATISHLVQQATMHHTAGRPEMARQVYLEILKLDHAHAEAHYGLGQCLGRLGRITEGLGHAQRAVQLQPKRVQYQISLADLYFAAGQINESIAAAGEALLLDSRNIHAHCILANGLERQLNFEAGIAQLTRAEEIAPQNIQVQTLLARFERRNKNYREAERRIEKILSQPDVAPELRRRMHFEEAFVLDKIGNYDGAYKAIVNYGQLTMNLPSVKRLDRHAFPTLIAAYKAGLDAELLNRWSADDFADVRAAPAFLVGFPRSGTTMTEQILAAHPQISTADERPYLHLVRKAWMKQAGGGEDIREMFERLTIAGAKELRALYWKQVDAEFGADLDDGILVDKLPLSLIDLGLINVLFPDAKVIIALRDPRDICLSALMQDFGLNNAMIHFFRLEDAARFYTEVMDLYLTLRPILTLDSLEIRYEDTVDDLATQAKRMLSLLGVEWDPGILNFHLQARERTISTPSLEAVMEPIHRGAVGRWKNYREHFASILPTLEPFVTEFGYS